MCHHQKHSIQKAIASFQGRTAVLVGDFLLDTYIFGKTARVSREAPVLVVKKERVEHRLGGAANAAANLAALGVQTKVIGVLGNDAAGKQLLNMLKLAHVDTSCMQHEGRPTPEKIRILAGAVGTSKQQVLRLDEEPPQAIETEVAGAIMKHLHAEAAHADVVVVSDYGAGVLSNPVIEAIKQVSKSNVPVCVDSRFQLPCFEGVTAVTPNVPEAEAIVGFPIENDENVARAGNCLLQRLQCQACLLTQGRNGMSLFQQEKTPCHVGILGEDEVTDVTGAGDTVMATFAACVAGGLSFSKAMQLANAAAGLAVMRAGTATVSCDELVQAATQSHIELGPWDK